MTEESQRFALGKAALKNMIQIRILAVSLAIFPTLRLGMK